MESTLTSNVYTDDDRRWMAAAIDLSRQCPPSLTAYSVGAILLDAHGHEIARGWSRDTDVHIHAEESALSQVAKNDPRLLDATLYSSLEPCSERRSVRATCTQLILAANIPRIVIAWREPPLFVNDGRGYEILRAAGREVVEIAELANEAAAINAHLLGRR